MQQAIKKALRDMKGAFGFINVYFGGGVDKFDTLVALIFSRLFSDFPEPVRLDPASFLERVINKNDESGSFNFHEYFWHTVNWLVSEGYVRIVADYSSISRRSYDIVLTRQGLESLRKVPDSLQGEESLGQRMVKFSEDKRSVAAGALVSLAIASPISAIT